MSKYEATVMIAIKKLEEKLEEEIENKTAPPTTATTPTSPTTATTPDSAKKPGVKPSWLKSNWANWQMNGKPNPNLLKKS
jgi:hypothetical protein